MYCILLHESLTHQSEPEGSVVLDITGSPHRIPLRICLTSVKFGRQWPEPADRTSPHTWWVAVRLGSNSTLLGPTGTRTIQLIGTSSSSSEQTPLPYFTGFSNGVRSSNSNPVPKPGTQPVQPDRNRSRTEETNSPLSRTVQVQFSTCRKFPGKPASLVFPSSSHVTATANRKPELRSRGLCCRGVVPGLFGFRGADKCWSRSIKWSRRNGDSRTGTEPGTNRNRHVQTEGREDPDHHRRWGRGSGSQVCL